MRGSISGRDKSSSAASAGASVSASGARSELAVAMARRATVNRSQSVRRDHCEMLTNSMAGSQATPSLCKATWSTL